MDDINSKLKKYSLPSKKPPQFGSQKKDSYLDKNIYPSNLILNNNFSNNSKNNSNNNIIKIDDGETTKKRLNEMVKYEEIKINKNFKRDTSSSNSKLSNPLTNHNKKENNYFSNNSLNHMINQKKEINIIKNVKAGIKPESNINHNLIIEKNELLLEKPPGKNIQKNLIIQRNYTKEETKKNQTESIEKSIKTYIHNPLSNNHIQKNEILIENNDILTTNDITSNKPVIHINNKEDNILESNKINSMEKEIQRLNMIIDKKNQDIKDRDRTIILLEHKMKNMHKESITLKEKNSKSEKSRSRTCFCYGKNQSIRKRNLHE